MPNRFINILIKSEMIVEEGEGYGKIYFPSALVEKIYHSSERTHLPELPILLYLGLPEDGEGYGKIYFPSALVEKIYDEIVAMMKRRGMNV